MIGIKPVVESQHGMTRLAADGLDGMGVALWKIPEITRSVIGNLGFACGVDHRDLALTAQDVGPFGRIMPMHLARAAGVHEQMRPCDIGREREPRAGKVARPTAGGGLDRSTVERE